MRLAIFVCPMLSEAASRMIVAAASLPDIRLGVITHEPITSAPDWARGAIAYHWQVRDILDPSQLVWGAEGIAHAAAEPVERMFGAYEQAQVPIAQARERLGIPGMPSDVARNFRDKARMKDILRANGVPCARHALATSVASAVADAAAIGYPVVVKPPAGAGAVATHRVDNAAELKAALAIAPPSPGRPALIEEFLTGEEHSLETVTLDGSAVWHSLTHYAPTPLDVVRNPWIQWCVLLPRETTHPRYDDIKRAAEHALRVLGMQNGLSHTEWFRRPDGSIAIGEIGARPPGAQITTMISRANDTDFLAEWARVMVFGEFVRPEQKYAVGAAFLRGQGAGGGAPGDSGGGHGGGGGPGRGHTPARVRSVRGLHDVVREVGDLVCDAKLPREGQVPTGSYEGEGFIIVRHPETAVVERALQHIVSRVRVELA